MKIGIGYKHMKSKKKRGNKKSLVKELNNNYISYSGNVYEKISDSCEDIEIELQIDVLNKLTGLVDSGKFVSIGEAVRHIIRLKLQELEQK